MLFNSYEFIFAFLPITLIGFFVIGRSGGHKAAIAWLVATSMFYYAWWNPIYLVLLLMSVVFNYALGGQLHRNSSRRRVLLILGVTVNLAALGYFKYFNFMVDNANRVLNSTFQPDHVVLPLAISFFTFQQIAYLVDTYRHETEERSFLNYCLFVTFFPQLIAGPIVHHKEMLPQFALSEVLRPRASNLSVGLSLFAIGLFKKVVLADGIAAYATPVFAAADGGAIMTFFEAWGGVLAYTFQLYFDFSGYSDMAIGLGRMFGVRLPLNFFSPYKAVNIIDFWRRWHITLSRFLRDYLYIPLGGNRKGSARRHVNLMLTMILGGLWHGAGWTFVLWGALHGLYLVVNNVWQSVTVAMGRDLRRTTVFGRLCGRALTFLCVVVGWVFFRAETFEGAIRMLKGMALANGALLDNRLEGALRPFARWIDFGGYGMGTFGSWGVIWIAALGAIVFLAPNAVQIMYRFQPAFEIYPGQVQRSRAWLEWRPSLALACMLAVVLFFTVTRLTNVSEFLYFQF